VNFIIYSKLSFADSSKSAVNAINAGCDMIFRPANYNEAYEGVLAAVNDGTISAERLDEALMRIYSKKFQ
jgi:beta-N-acetylhexosaminidase